VAIQSAARYREAPEATGYRRRHHPVPRRLPWERVTPRAGQAAVSRFGKLTGALPGENERADDFIGLIGAYLYPAHPYGDRGCRITVLTEVFGIYETVDQAIAATKGSR
jgi:hypothetical protein